MAISNITQLPSGILIDIFQFVERKDLFQLTTVCKLFNDVISNSPTLLFEMPLNFNKSNMRQEFIGTRKYSNIIVSGEKLKARLPFIKSIAGSIVKFQLRHKLDYGFRYKEYWRSFKIEDLVELLRMLPKLRHLCICPPYYLKKKALKDDLMLTLKLDSLSGNFGQMYPLFYNCRVKEFSLNENYYGSLELIEFLKRQKDLKYLEINSYNKDLFKDNSLANVDFKLKKLKLVYTHSRFDIYDGKIENMLQFLQQFRDSLELFELGSYNHQVLSKLLPEFKKLKELKICGYDYFKNYPDLILPSVERLHLLNDKFITSVTASMFPNLQHFTFGYELSTDLEQFTKLKSISAMYPRFKIGPTSAKTLTIKQSIHSEIRPFDFDNNSFEEIHVTIRPGDYPQWLKEFIDGGYAANLKIFSVQQTDN